MGEKRKALVEFQEHGRVHLGIVHANSVLSTLNVSHLGTEILEYVQRYPGLNLLLDFSQVNYLSSVVLTELLRVKRAVDETDGRLRLCGMGSTIREVFAITNLDRVFSIHEESFDVDIKRFERSLEIAAADAAWKEIAE